MLVLMKFRIDRIWVFDPLHANRVGSSLAERSLQALVGKNASSNLATVILDVDSVDWCYSQPLSRCIAHTDTVSEWLRRWTRNPLGSARRGSNPLGVGI